MKCESDRTTLPRRWLHHRLDRSKQSQPKGTAADWRHSSMRGAAATSTSYCVDGATRSHSLSTSALAMSAIKAHLLKMGSIIPPLASPPPLPLCALPAAPNSKTAQIVRASNGARSVMSTACCLQVTAGCCWLSVEKNAARQCPAARRDGGNPTSHTTIRSSCQLLSAAPRPGMMPCCLLPQQLMTRTGGAAPPSWAPPHPPQAARSARDEEKILGVTGGRVRMHSSRFHFMARSPKQYHSSSFDGAA